MGLRQQQILHHAPHSSRRLGDHHENRHHTHPHLPRNHHHLRARNGHAPFGTRDDPLGAPNPRLRHRRPPQPLHPRHPNDCSPHPPPPPPPLLRRSREPAFPTSTTTTTYSSLTTITNILRHHHGRPLKQPLLPTPTPVPPLPSLEARPPPPNLLPPLRLPLRPLRQVIAISRPLAE